VRLPCRQVHSGQRQEVVGFVSAGRKSGSGKSQGGRSQLSRAREQGVRPWGAYIEKFVLSPQSRDNNKIVNMATMDTTRLNRKDLARYSMATTWSPWLPRTQPRRVWTPNGLHGGTFRESTGPEEGPQVYEKGKLKYGGQGRNCTASASLFRDVRSITYRQPFMKTRDLHDNDLDSRAFLGRFGLHVDSTNGQPLQPCSGTELAPTRAVDPAF
jgi:hypothetical protein